MSDDECCQLSRAAPIPVQQRQELLDDLERRIKARRAQMGGYLHDAKEHRLEAARLLREGDELGARTEIRSSLECTTVYKREEAKYRNLVSLHRTLQEAKRNLSMAELFRSCTEEVQATLARMPDVVELRNKWDQQKDRVQEDEQELLPKTIHIQEEEDLDLPCPPTVTDQQVNEALKQLRTPLPTSEAATKREKCIVPQ